MTRIERSIDIETAPERVFEALVDWRELTRWSTITVEHRGADRCQGVGDAFEQTLRIAGTRLKTRWIVTEHDPPHVVAYRVEGVRGGRMRMRQEVAATRTGSRFDLLIDYELPGGPLGKLVDRVLARPRNEREAERTLNNLKARLEGSGA